MAPDIATRRPVAQKSDLRIGDTVHDPAGHTTGRVVNMEPRGWTDDPRERVTVEWHWAGWRSDPLVEGLEICRPRCTLCGKLPEERCSCFSFPPDVLRHEPAEVRVDAAVAQIKARGFTVRFVEWCESADTPGFLGQIRGVTDRQSRLVRIGTRANPTVEDLAETAEHELRHVADPAWDCGNRDVFGRGGASRG